MIGALPFAMSLSAARLSDTVMSKAITPKLNILSSARSVVGGASSSSAPAVAAPVYVEAAAPEAPSSRLPLIAGVALAGVAAVVVVLKLKKRKK